MIRFILSLLFFFTSLLAIVEAPTNGLWKLSIAVIEWGQYFAIVVIILSFFNLKKDRRSKIALFLNLIAVICFLSTVTKAYIHQGFYEKQISKLYPDSKKITRAKAILLKELFTGINYKEQIPKEYLFDKINGLKLDFYQASQQNAPCVIVVHGGAWSTGDKKQLPKLNSYLSQRGYGVVSISYRLAPKYTYPVQVADVLNAIKWVKQNALLLCVDSSRLVLLGRSAGAQLAQQAAYTHIDKNIKGLISFYCPADLVWGYSAPGNPLVLDSRKVLDQYIGATAYQRQDLYEAASPAYHVTTDVPPTLLLHGRPDVMVAWEHSRRMNEKLRLASVNHLFLDLPWATHGYDYAFNGPSSQISLYAIEHFLGSVCY